MEKDLEASGITSFQTMFGMLEGECSVRDMIEALEASKVRILDSFGRNIAPRTEDVSEIRAALLEYARFNNERIRLGTEQSEQCLEYFKSFEGFVCSGPVDTPYTPILGRAWVVGSRQSEEIFTSLLTEAARTLRNTGGRAAERLKARELALPFAIEGRLQHNVVTDILWATIEPDGTRSFQKLAESGVRKIVKEVYKENGLFHLIKGRRTRPTNSEVS